MSYTDLRDFSPEVTFHLYGSRPISISLEKLGGGTVGNSYTGTWRYIVTWGDQETFREQRLDCALPTTHLGAARVLASWFASYGDPGSGYDGDNLPTGTALEMCRHEHDTFSLFADELDR